MALAGAARPHEGGHVPPERRAQRVDPSLIDHRSVQHRVADPRIHRARGIDLALFGQVHLVEAYQRRDAVAFGCGQEAIQQATIQGWTQHRNHDDQAVEIGDDDVLVAAARAGHFTLSWPDCLDDAIAGGIAALGRAPLDQISGHRKRRPVRVGPPQTPPRATLGQTVVRAEHGIAARVGNQNPALMQCGLAHVFLRHHHVILQRVESTVRKRPPHLRFRRGAGCSRRSTMVS